VRPDVSSRTHTVTYVFDPAIANNRARSRAQSIAPPSTARGGVVLRRAWDLAAALSTLYLIAILRNPRIRGPTDGSTRRFRLAHTHLGVTSAAARRLDCYLRQPSMEWGWSCRCLDHCCELATAGARDFDVFLPDHRCRVPIVRHCAWGW